MNKALIAAVSSVLLLAGCASGPDEATTARLDELNTQVSELREEVAALKSEQQAVDSKATEASDAVKSAQSEAARANERIDNIAKSYKK